MHCDAHVESLGTGYSRLSLGGHHSPDIMNNLPDHPEYDEITNIKHSKSLYHPNSDKIASDEGYKSHTLPHETIRVS